MSIRTTKWFTNFRPQPDAPRRLFCFPYAGAGASVFRTWAQDLPAGIDLLALQLPGRETRIREPLYTSLGPLVEELSRAILPWLDRPFAFFGHSMGGLIGFELARALARIGAPQPRVLFVSARRAPRAPGVEADSPLHTLSDGELRDELIRMKGMDQAVLENEDLMSFLLPILRADFAICETYRPALDAPLGCPIVAFGGDEDHTVDVAHLEAWRAETSAALTVKVFPGSHFYFKESWKDFTRALSRSLEQLVAGPAAPLGA